jgi:hypothetical protein
VLIFGAKSRCKVVTGGRVEQRHCDKCEQLTTFRECDVTDRFSVFFVELGQSTQRRLVCCECGEDLPLETPAEPERRARRDAPAARATRTTPPAPQKAALSEREKDRLLADLKKKMNKR